MSQASYPAIILAGGLGTRLRSVINGMPKPMAPVNGKPFLHYIFAYLAKQGVSEAILAVGYKHELIKGFLGTEYFGIKVRYSVEEEPLGTGGGIKKAFDLVNDFAFVINGDTFFDVSLSSLQDFYFETQGDLTIALKKLTHFDRYGTVSLDTTGRITEFNEKKFMEKGLINGGVYFTGPRLFASVETTEKFSFEKDILEKYVSELNFTGKIFDNYFIDIGIPDDYQKAQQDFSN
jgi:D-glycero-alpha-D-manno-heptose 1-phosphate guanylyltransferase